MAVSDVSVRREDTWRGWYPGQLTVFFSSMCEKLRATQDYQGRDVKIFVILIKSDNAIWSIGHHGLHTDNISDMS